MRKIVILFYFFATTICLAKDPIVASMSSIPEREACLQKVVNAILPQVDHLNVYLNNYDHIPHFLVQPKITVARSQEFGDIGDNGKFFWTASIKGYHFTIDDDILYSPSYAKYCVNQIEKYHRKAVVGIHGSILNEPVNNYYRDRKIFYFAHALAQNVGVHILGTGTVAYHTDTIKVTLDDFPRKNMTDIWFALLGQVQKVPFICLKHPKRFLIDLAPPGPAISRTAPLSCEFQTEVVSNHSPWIIWAK